MPRIVPASERFAKNIRGAVDAAVELRKGHLSEIERLSKFIEAEQRKRIRELESQLAAKDPQP